MSIRSASSSPSGRSANWYPYFFLDPDEAGGYGMISFYALGLSVVIVAVSVALLASAIGFAVAWPK